MTQRKRLDSQQQNNEQQHAMRRQESQEQTAREFGSVEELLRHDALHTPVPPAVAHRLQQSIAQIPPPPRSWWQRFLGI
jgi:hypothetical protein